MAERLTTEIDRLAAPSGDGAILVWPGGSRLADLLERNRKRLNACTGRVLGQPLCEWRDASGPPVVLAGHQPSFFHAGVWAKAVAAVQLASKVGGSAVMLVVDSDVCHGLALSWPVMKDTRLAVATAEAAPAAKALSFEQLCGPPADDWRGFFSAVAPCGAGEPGGMLPVFTRGFLGAPVAERSGDYVSRWCGGVAAVHRALGVDCPRFQPTSEAFSFGSRAVAGLVAHLLLNAGSFAAAYNGALAQYRARRGLRGTEHPIPDLHIAGERVESPFWLLEGNLPRRRLWVEDVPGGCRLSDGRLVIAQLDGCRLRSQPAEALARALGPVGLRPRALAQMIYARLLASDLCLHGIGGAKYDQVTDEIIRRFLGFEPPAYACVSATLRLVIERFAVSLPDRRKALARIRDYRHNPQRTGGVVRDEGAWKVALAARQAAVGDSLRLREGSRGDRPARRSAYERIQRANEALRATLVSREEDLARNLADIDTQLAHNAIADQREWFFAFQPAARLRGLCERLGREIGAPAGRAEDPPG